MSVKGQSEFYSLAKFSSRSTQPDTGGFTAGERSHTHTANLWVLPLSLAGPSAWLDQIRGLLVWMCEGNVRGLWVWRRGPARRKPIDSWTSKKGERSKCVFLHSSDFFKQTADFFPWKCECICMCNFYHANLFVIAEFDNKQLSKENKQLIDKTL